METFFGGVALAGVTGLAWLAWRAPRMFFPIGNGLFSALMLILCCAAVHDLSARATLGALSELMDPETVKRAAKVVEGREVLSWGTFGMWVSALGYVGLMWVLAMTRRFSDLADEIPGRSGRDGPRSR